MFQITLPTEKQLFGYTALQVIKDFGTYTEVTDFAACLGAHTYNAASYIFNKPSCPTLTSSADQDNEGFLVINSDQGHPIYSRSLTNNNFAIRPVLTAPMELKYLQRNKIQLPKAKQVNTITVCEYPQTYDEEKTAAYRENSNLFNRPTGKQYTIGITLQSDNTYQTMLCREYQIGKDKYVCAPAKISNVYQKGNRRVEFQKNQIYVFKVEPVKWLFDESGLAISQKAIVSGIPFDRGSLYLGDYSKTFMSHYMDNYLKYEILPTQEYCKQKHCHTITKHDIIAPLAKCRVFQRVA